MKKNLFLTLLMLLISSFVYAQEEEWKEWSGTFGAQGDNLRWKLSSWDRTLYISGVGAMENFDSGTLPPWRIGEAFEARIDLIIIGEGVTTIGNDAFYATRFSYLELPSSIVSIGFPNLYYGDEGATIRTHWMKPLNFFPEYAESSFPYEIIVPYGTKDAYIAAGWTEGRFHGGVKEQPLAQGTCGKDGDNLTWMVTEDGTLTISGQGEMKDYRWDPDLVLVRHPWQFCYDSNGGRWDPDDFGYRYEVKKIIIEEGVTSIGSQAFNMFGEYDDTKGPIDISLPNSLKSIGDKAFKGCSNLTNIQLPKGVTSIGEWAFYNCESLKSINIPDGVKSIEHGTFEGCSNLTNVQLSEGLTSIDGGVFSGCESLKSIKIPGSVTLIDVHAFEGTSLSSIVVDSKNSVYDSRDNCNAIIETATNSLFIGCKKTVIPNSVTSIGDYAFQGCTGLTSIVIPDGVKSIGYDAFYGCTGLTSIEILNSLTSVGGNIFEGTAWYDNQPDGVVYINHIAYGYKWSDDELFWEEYEKGMDLVLKEGTIQIAPNAFLGCWFLKSVVIPGSVKMFESAFLECNITSVKILEGVTSISDGAFWCCTALKSIDIPSSVKSIGDLAFASCMSLKDVYCYAETVPEIIAEAFYDVEIGNITLHVPAASIEAYKSAEPWCNFGTIVGIEEPSIEIEPISESTEMAFIIGEEIDLNSVIVNNTYFTLDAENGDGYDALQQAVVLKSTTTEEQMSVVQDAKVGDDEVRDNYNGIIFEVSAGSGTISVDAQTIGTYVLNIQIGKNKPTKVTKAERGLVEVRYNVMEPTYVYLYASSAESSAARLRNARSVAENSVLLYGYTVSLDDMILGDGTGDGVVDISDYIGVANHILGIPQTGFNADAADVNMDGIIDISDYIGVANIILTGKP